MHYATSQKVVGSIPDEVIEFFQFTSLSLAIILAY
jgi:hypothetical protein